MRREKVNSQKDSADMSEAPNNQPKNKKKPRFNKENEKCT